MTRTRVPFLTLALLLLVPLGLVAQPKGDWKALLEKRTFKEGGGEMPYRLMKPEGYDPKKSYPLVVFLHGAGERGKNNENQLVHGVRDFAKAEHRKKYPCFLIAPQCPAGSFWTKKEPERLVLELIPALRKEFSIDARRIYITGLSMGGYGTWDLLARRPELFAAAVPICGGGNPKMAERFAKVPIWAFHGDKDGAVPVASSREMIAAIEKAGGKPKYTEYKGVGHDSWTQTYRDEKMFAWLFEQKKK
jgi:predicted peptidase